MLGSSDFDYVGCVDDKKSTSCFIFMMVERVVSCRSVKQKLTSSSTMKARYMACYKATCHAIWLQNFILTFGIIH